MGSPNNSEESSGVWTNDVRRSSRGRLLVYCIIGYTPTKRPVTERLVTKRPVTGRAVTGRLVTGRPD
jgi:hypothetical protein